MWGRGLDLRAKNSALYVFFAAVVVCLLSIHPCCSLFKYAFAPTSEVVVVVVYMRNSVAELLLNRTGPTSCVRDLTDSRFCRNAGFANACTLNGLLFLVLVVVWPACVHRDTVLVMVVDMGWCNGCMAFVFVLMSVGRAPESTENNLPSYQSTAVVSSGSVSPIRLRMCWLSFS